MNELSRLRALEVGQGDWLGGGTWRPGDFAWLHAFASLGGWTGALSNHMGMRICTGTVLVLEQSFIVGS